MIAKESTVAFTGNRVLTPPRDILADDLVEEIFSLLSGVLEQLYQSGKRHFISGGAVGFDMLAADAVLDLRSKYEDVELTIAVPFEGQEYKYSESAKIHYCRLLAAADRVEIVCDSYSLGAYHQRNEYMIEKSSCVVAYNNRQGKGTASTIRRAARCGLEIIDIYALMNDSATESQLTLDL